jgi:hypothetical protein
MRQVWRETDVEGIPDRSSLAGNVSNQQNQKPNNWLRHPDPREVARLDHIVEGC